MRPVVRNPNPSPAPPRWFRHRWPWLLMLGPFLVILAGSYTCYLAFSRQDALVVGDYYNRGKAINQDLRRDRVASARALDFTLAYDGPASLLRGRLLSGGAPSAENLVLHLAHATQPEKDIDLAFKPDAQGNFSVALALLERSRWQVVLENEKRDWRLEGNWTWPAQGSIRIAAASD